MYADYVHDIQEDRDANKDDSFIEDNNTEDVNFELNKTTESVFKNKTNYTPVFSNSNTWCIQLQSPYNSGPKRSGGCSDDKDLQDTLLQIDALNIPLSPQESNIHVITTVAEIYLPLPDSPKESHQSHETTSENLSIDNDFDISNDLVPTNIQDEAAGIKTV
ncbi:unnamed protein product [Mytilus coruscus]|uniref:Uncharacterized protein n=1 Tax=Mytilus coruscus TaxID=42192 RepID=A0A6J8DUS1_MYTCO|nr:unnamed protein product [Mytilus coruscus]